MSGMSAGWAPRGGAASVKLPSRFQRAAAGAGANTRPATSPSGARRALGGLLPGERSRDQMRGVEILVVRETVGVRGEEAVERCSVIDSHVLVADASAEIEILAFDAGAQREDVPVPVLEAGSQVGSHLAELDLAVELAVFESPAE